MCPPPPRSLLRPRCEPEVTRATAGPTAWGTVQGSSCREASKENEDQQVLQKATGKRFPCGLPRGQRAGLATGQGMDSPRVSRPRVPRAPQRRELAALRR